VSPVQSAGSNENRSSHLTFPFPIDPLFLFGIDVNVDVEGQLAAISYPDPAGTQIVVSNPSESAMGASREQTIPFQFDKVRSLFPFPFYLDARRDWGVQQTD
jgi:hypothetical protein